MGNSPSSNQDNIPSTSRAGVFSSSVRSRNSSNLNSRSQVSKSKKNSRLIPRAGNPNTLFNSCQSALDNKKSDKSFDQIIKAKRLGFLRHLPISIWNICDEEDVKECCICMVDFEENEKYRCLPCMHYYHVDCIDDWLVRSFLCPTCRQPTDAAIFSTLVGQF